MTKITKGGAVFRLVVMAVVAYVGAVLLVLQGVDAPTWGQVFAPVVVLKGIAAAGYSVGQFVNTAWAQANQTGIETAGAGTTEDPPGAPNRVSASPTLAQAPSDDEPSVGPPDNPMTPSVVRRVIGNSSDAGGPGPGDSRRG